MRPLVPLFLVLALVASACSVSEEEVVTPTSGDPGPSTTTTGPDDVGETGPADGGDDDGAGGGVDGAATGLPQVELALVPLDTAGLDPDASFEGGFVDGGSTASLLLADDAPVVVTAGAAGVTLRAVADLVPELEPRVAPGFSHLATCAGMLVLVLTGPDAVVGVDLASGAVAWETGVAPDLQITCGDSGVVVVQDAGYVHG